MSALQNALLNAGLTTQQKIEKIERQEALQARLARVSKKIAEGRGRPTDYGTYARLKRRAPKSIRFAY